MPLPQMTQFAEEMNLICVPVNHADLWWFVFAHVSSGPNLNIFIHRLLFCFVCLSIPFTPTQHLSLALKELELMKFQGSKVGSFLRFGKNTGHGDSNTLLVY